MPKSLQKSLQGYVSKLKKNTLPFHNPPKTLTSTSWLLSACKHPKTASFAVARNQSDGQDNAATLMDIDRFLFENFKSLYTDDHKNEYDKSVILSDSPRFENEYDKSVILSDSPRFVKTPPHLHASDRFFVGPGLSDSLVEEARLSASTKPDDDPPELPDHTVAVPAFSKDPYADFRQSMHEMVEARQVDQCQPLDWDFLEELLFCYLKLNEKRAHKYIIGAFVDLMVSFRRGSDRIPVSQDKIPATKKGGGREKKGGMRAFCLERGDM
ncbi:transcription repressor OFP14-like [Tasmannia lanceolata]|uniref:transcription repressor OFP14-like n=1 Tax=Tasmannia lanceolata TaxID=3420 RepID=UPI004062E324